MKDRKDQADKCGVVVDAQHNNENAVLVQPFNTPAAERSKGMICFLYINHVLETSWLMEGRAIPVCQNVVENEIRHTISSIDQENY